MRRSIEWLSAWRLLSLERFALSDSSEAEREHIVMRAKVITERTDFDANLRLGRISRSARVMCGGR